MRDTYPIKYWIPKLNFTVKPQSSQSYKVQYIKYSDYNANTDWVTVATSYTVDVDGNTSSSNKLEFLNLAENTEYVMRFTDILNRNYDFKFKTGKDVSLADSPYYNKTLFPGQTYDWYINDVGSYSNPDKNQTKFYFKLDGKKAVTIDTDNWNSLVNLEENGNYFIPSLNDGTYEYITDSNGYNIMGYSFNNTVAGSGKSITLPFVKYNGTSFVNCTAYWFDDGGGGISLGDVIKNGMNIGFAFLVKDSVTTDQILCGFDTTKTEATAGIANLMRYSITFTSDCHLKTTYTEGTSVNTVTDTHTLLKNKWYYCILGSTLSVYTMDAKNGTNTQTFTTITCSSILPSSSYFSTNFSASPMLPFYFGSMTTSGVVIARIIGGLVSQYTSDVVNMMLNTFAFMPQLKLSGTTSSNNTWSYSLPSKCTGAILPTKVSFVIDPDIFTNVATLTGVPFNSTGTVTAQLMINNVAKDSKTFSGFSYTNTTSGTTVNVGGIIDNSSYKESSYDLVFAEATDPIKSLSEHFFTKHGTWGGYNGGVNGHNIYFNSSGNLILECHGDSYSGSLKGVGKEQDQTTYSGYGGDVTYSSNTWDQRTNKNCLRVGTALVSNKYISYGRVDVNLRLPVGIWGVCPAIWLFHYIELSDSDYRYNLSPYSNRNIQGSNEDGFYRIVNNEIDIEMPSHLTNGIASSWTDVSNAYFDLANIDNQMHIGVSSDASSDNIGLFNLTDIANPNTKSSWAKTSSSIKPRYLPSFQNCKFNNWVGELNSGNGWCTSKVADGVTITAENYYKGTGTALTNQKEEYMSQLTHLVDNEHGYADGKFHKWSIIWLPDRTVLLVDDVVIRENRGFVPFNQMKFTVAGWFPTMAVDNKTSPTGVKDSDGIHSTTGTIITPINDNPGTSIGTWAGTQAAFDVLHLEISEIKYTKYNVGDNITINNKTTNITSEPSALGESFPESGLRMFVE